jgi:hypothetical protein
MLLLTPHGGHRERADVVDESVVVEQHPPLEILSARHQAGLGFYFKVLATGRVYRLAPQRYPRQPRFWSIFIYRCLPGGAPDPNERAWLSDDMLAREALPEAIASVKADLAGWLESTGGDALRAWLAEPAPVTIPGMP